MARDAENCFGLNGATETSFSIKCNRCFHCSRSFELWMSDNSLDSLYSSGLTNCSNCMFSFDIWNKKYAIGNLELPKDKYLSRHTHPTAKCTSAATGKEMIMPTFSTYPKLPRDRLLDINEAQVFGQSIHIGQKDAEGITLKNAHKTIGPLAFFHIDLIAGKNTNLIECATYASSSNSYRCSAVGYSKYCAYSFWPMHSQYLFGTDSPFDSRFSINIYSCTNQTRCFEIDCCGYCMDTYFSHNCENVNDSMFCFNTKNKRCCIGNAPLPPEEYKRIKSSLLSQLYDELNTKKDLKYDIYNILCGGK